MKTITEYINDNEYDIDFDCENIFNQILETILISEGLKIDANITVSLVDEATIKELNNNMRSIDKVTDVLSFPNIPFESPADFNMLTDEVIGDYMDIDLDTLFLGDVVICYKRACEQAEEYGHSLKRELCFLTAHSILHLLGYDHMEEAEREIMEDKQRKVLEALNISR